MRQPTPAGMKELLIFSMVSLLETNELLSRNNSEVNNGDNAGFGKSSSVGDFNGDGYDDLVIGVPYEDVNSETDAGAIQIFMVALMVSRIL